MGILDDDACAIRLLLPNRPLPANRFALSLIVVGLLLAGPAAHAIRGGQPADTGKWAYHVGLFKNGSQFCGGTLVAPRFVLTAAHCASAAAVYVGSQELRRAQGSGRLRAGSGQLINVAAVHIHPSYDGNRTQDIALLELATAAPASYGTATLPNLAIHNRIAADEVQAVAIGWGTSTPYSSSIPSTWPPTRLQQASLTLKSQDACSQLMGGVFNREAHICTQDVQQDRGICQGDSGGPLFVYSNGIDYQVGIASFAESFYSGVLLCSTSGFTKVATYAGWINDRISPPPPDPPSPPPTPPPPPPPPPPPSNRAPEAVHPIDELSLLPNASRQIDASAAFHDPDGDRLAYSAQSADPAVATASVQGEAVRIAAKTPGSASITLAATDPGGLSAQLVFSVRVEGPPVAVGEIAALSLPAGALASIDAAAKFADPNEDELAYQGASSNAAVAAVALDGSLASIVAKAPGTATLTIRAANGDGRDGSSASLSFPVRVAAALPNQELRAGGDVLTMPLSSLFADAGGLVEPAASSSDIALVRAGIADGILTLASVGQDEGVAIISVAATCRSGWRKTLRFQAELTAMRIFLRGWRLHWLRQAAHSPAYAPCKSCAVRSGEGKLHLLRNGTGRQQRCLGASQCAKAPEHGNA